MMRLNAKPITAQALSLFNAHNRQTDNTNTRDNSTPKTKDALRKPNDQRRRRRRKRQRASVQTDAPHKRGGERPTLRVHIPLRGVGRGTSRLHPPVWRHHLMAPRGRRTRRLRRSACVEQHLHRGGWSGAGLQDGLQVRYQALLPHCGQVHNCPSRGLLNGNHRGEGRRLYQTRRPLQLLCVEPSGRCSGGTHSCRP